MSIKLKIRRFFYSLVPRRLVLNIELLASKSDFLANFYYLLRGGFSREHRAVLFGRTLHRRQLLEAKWDEGARHTLRRYIHMLEKGLIMRPRRPVFAKDYIADTMDLFEAITRGDPSSASQECNPLCAWAADVLDEYFHVTGDDPLINLQRDRFLLIINERSVVLGPCRPYQRDLSTLRIAYDDLLQLARRRRSCRWYLPQPVPREVIDRAILVAAQSPSACNRQPFEFRIFVEPDEARRIGAIPLGTKGFADSFQCVAVVVGKLRAFPFERDRHVPYIDGALAAMAFQFALEVQGVSSCCINFPDLSGPEEAMAAALKLQPDERPVMLISFGYPDPTGAVPFSQKKTLDELRRYHSR